MHDEVIEGQILAGKYRVERVLGVGGMGLVVAARHLQLDERVALKFMLWEMLTNAEAVARFAREARAAVKIKSEHVARVSDVGVLENGAPYMVMEYLDGGDLSGWLKQHGQLTVEQTVEFMLQASEAIAEAHALGIVHRDLKPANLFLIRRPDGAHSIKVLDFGISKVTGLDSSAPDFDMTKTSAVMGSPNYMSPEQMHSVRDVDARSDIWALGVILYELLAGVTPFAAEAFPELVLKIATKPPMPLRSYAPDVPLGLEKVILKCLEKDPGRRYATIGDLAVALMEFGPRRSKLSVERITGVLKAAGMSASALALPPSSDPTTVLDAGTAASWEQTAPGGGRSKRALFTAAAVLGVGALAAAGYAVRGRAPQPPASAAAVVAAAAVSHVSSSNSTPSSTEPAPTPSDTPAPPDARSLAAAPIALRAIASPKPKSGASKAPPAPGALNSDPPKLAPKSVVSQSSPAAAAPPIKPASAAPDVFHDR